MTDDPREELPPSEDVIDRPKEDQAPPPPPPNGNGKTETISDLVTKARESIPVGERGLTPMAYEHQVTIAKDRSRAYLMLPEHLHNNVAVVTALVGIAARFNLDPIMLASKTYIQNNRLCFEAQAFGAILYGSGLLIGRLKFEFRGENEDMICAVSGRFKDDPDTVHIATTPTLKQLHPGYSKKEGKQHMVSGSPLWDKDPEQQLAYFAERRWIRRYAPDACMGMYTADEVREIDEYRAGRGDTITLNSDRLGQLDTGEGWGEGAHLDMDLAAIAPELPEDPEPDGSPDEPSPSRRPAQPQRKPGGAKKPVVRPKIAPAKKTPPAKPVAPRKTFRGREPSKVEVRAAVKRAEAGPPPRRSSPPPKWLDYVGRTEAWIKAIDSPEAADTAMARWEGDRDERDKLTVPMGERSRLRAILDRKVVQFAPPKKGEEPG
jgi:hypothetical protein